MKTSLKKSVAVLMAVLMVLTLSPMSAIAATTLTFTEDTGINTDNYSFMVYDGNDDYIANVLEGVGKDKTITATQGDIVTVVMNAGEYTSTSRNSVDFSSYTTGSYHYGNSSSYCIATDTPFTLSGYDGWNNQDITATVSGFGASATGNGNYGGSQSNTSISTTFTIDTTNIHPGTHQIHLAFKYQMKSKNFIGSWSTGKEYVATYDNTPIVLNLVVEEPDNTVVARGGSIRITDPAGLRFGFHTVAAPEEVQDYGFVYAYGVKTENDLTIENAGSNGVRNVNAPNHDYHEEDGTTTFNLVFINMPNTNSAYDTTISARAYVKTTDGKIHYSEVLTRNYREVAQAVLADESIEQDIKDTVQSLLDSAV